MNKTNECWLCGSKEQEGLIEAPSVFQTERNWTARFKCKDEVACDQRIKNSLMKAMAPNPPPFGPLERLRGDKG